MTSLFNLKQLKEICDVQTDAIDTDDEEERTQTWCASCYLRLNEARTVIFLQKKYDAVAKIYRKGLQEQNRKKAKQTVSDDFSFGKSKLSETKQHMNGHESKTIENNETNSEMLLVRRRTFQFLGEYISKDLLLKLLQKQTSRVDATVTKEFKNLFAEESQRPKCEIGANDSLQEYKEQNACLANGSISKAEPSSAEKKRKKKTEELKKVNERIKMKSIGAFFKPKA